LTYKVILFFLSIKWFCTFIFTVAWRTNQRTQCSYRHVIFLRR